MNTSLLMVYICTILIIFIPYFWFIRMGKKNSQRRENFFIKIQKDHQLHLSIQEQWNENFIGIDTTAQRLVFCKFKEDAAEVNVYNLSELQNCQVKTTSQICKRNNKTFTQLQTIDLELQNPSSTKSVILHFYNADEMLSEEFEMERAEKWKAIIVKSLPKPRNTKKAA